MATVRCTACGYEAGIAIGGARESFEEYSAWPVTCADCRAITNANTQKSPLACDDCSSENVIELQDPRTYAGDGTDEVLRAWERKLTNGRYKCPQCRRFKLRVGQDSRCFLRLIFQTGEDLVDLW